MKPSQDTLSIESSNGLRVTIVDSGATIESIAVPLPSGPINAVLSYDEPRFYQTDPYYLGATVGPFANRISSSAFTLDGTTYQLDTNEIDRGNCLHGGTNGLHRRQFSIVRDDCGTRISCRTKLDNGDGGFPGNRSFEVIYELVDDWSLAIDFIVTTDQDTIVNLANHAYFNLGGLIDDHWIRVNSEVYTPVDDSLIPTGELRPVSGSEYDLREFQQLHDRRLDHNFVLDRSKEKPEPAAQLLSKETGLELSVLTTQPAMQVYTGDYLSQPFRPRQGICLEAQGFPDAPNQPYFPSTRLEPGAPYRQKTVYRFAFRAE
ncbi:MAG: aldose epimerase family protein [Woeseiaceae bacterium]|nr:aldose epimerase family protein [Woeseiaceae bacterium]